MESVMLIYQLCEDVMSDNTELLLFYFIACGRKRVVLRLPYMQLRESYYKSPTEEAWIEHYHEITFFQLFRMKKETFQKLLNVISENDRWFLIRKKYRGGNFPVQPEKALLVFLWYMATQDTLISIGQTFGLVPSTVMKIVNVFLYITLCLKKQYIFWPKTADEIDHIKNGFVHYPGVLGAVDGSQIDIKVVPGHQHDSYVNRYLHHSINAMVICTAQKILTYAFIGFPGSAHDSRFFSQSTFVRNIESRGSQIYFPDETYHILGDSAFPIRPWLMTPYKNNGVLNRVKRNHNYNLSADRVAVENVFGLIKGRFRRLIFINTYSISKAIEIATAACILHNFCYFNGDEWTVEHHDMDEIPEEQADAENNVEETRRAKQKRNRIAEELFINNN